MEAELANSGAHVDFSLWALFWAADWVVKSVMLGLLVASVWAWAIIVDKAMLYKRSKQEMNRFEKHFWSGQSLEELYQDLVDTDTRGMASIFVAAMKEWKRSHEQGASSYIGVQQRLDKVLDLTIARESDKLEARLTFLATVGSAAPFIGLFGTVWGIKHAFEEIAMQQSTNLAVVAPGIAEALLATGLGLLAAIPAVIFYNKLNQDTDRVIASYEGFADEFAMILSRQLDQAGT